MCGQKKFSISGLPCDGILRNLSYSSVYKKTPAETWNLWYLLVFKLNKHHLSILQNVQKVEQIFSPIDESPSNFGNLDSL